MAAAQKSQVVEKVRKYLINASDAEIEEAVDRAEEHFLSLTGRRQVPDRALWLWVDTALALHASGADGVSQQVSSVKRGDTTIQYQEGAGGITDIDSRIAKFRVAVSR